jgi:capsular polysaccharide biosynthesis protein
MNEQPLDLKRFMQIVWRRKILVGVLAALGLAVGIAYSTFRSPMLESQALVLLSPRIHDTSTQVVIASSDGVLSSALRSADPGMSTQTLRSRVHVQTLSSNVISITVQGHTAAQARATADAIAHSYIAYLGSRANPAGAQRAQLLADATVAPGTSLPIRLLSTGSLGLLGGLLIGAIAAFAISRSDRRLRQRNEIADSIGVPVLGSVPVGRPSDASGWARLMESYKPGAVHSWQLRTVLSYLGQAAAGNGSNGAGFSVGLVTLASDRKALALGPQLAVFAASLGIPTSLVIGPQQDANATAALRAACAEPPPSSDRPQMLRLAVADVAKHPRLPAAKLTIIVAVVDAQKPNLAGTLRTSTTVLGVTAGAATASQLVGVAVSAVTDGRQVDGILVADPDPADRTTGRVPQLVRRSQRSTPTRLTGTTTEARR